MSSIWIICTHPVTLLGVGGAAGANARFWISLWIEQTWPSKFPLGTLAVNVTGSLVLGLLFVLFFERQPAHYRSWYLLLGWGFCGGFTTFSTFALENFRLLREGMWMLTLVNVLVSVAASFLAVVLAYRLTEKVLFDK